MSEDAVEFAKIVTNPPPYCDTNSISEGELLLSHALLAYRAALTTLAKDAEIVMRRWLENRIEEDPVAFLNLRDTLNLPAVRAALERATSQPD